MPRSVDPADLFRHPALPPLPADAVGVVTTRHDRPERLAIYRPDGTLSNSFAQDQTPDDVAFIVLTSTGKTLTPLPGHDGVWYWRA